MPLTLVDDNALAALRAALAAEGLPTTDLETRGKRFYALSEDGTIKGFGGFEQTGREALLRSVVVLPAHRGGGVGARLVRELVKEAERAGIEALWLLTTSAADFFARHEFLRGDRAAAPPAISATAEFQSLCPASAVCMRRVITAR